MDNKNDCKFYDVEFDVCLFLMCSLCDCKENQEEECPYYEKEIKN